MRQAGKLRQAVDRLQLRVAAAARDKHASSLFAAADYLDDLLVAVKADLAALPAQVGELTDKGRKAQVDPRLLKALVGIFHAEMLEAGRDFGRLLERHAQATKNKEDRRSKLDAGRGDAGMFLSPGGLVNRAQFKKAGPHKKADHFDEESHMLAKQHQIEADGEVKERVKKARNINHMLGDVMSAFQRMTTMVTLQEAQIERIDQDTRTAETNIKKGRKEVEQIYDDVANKRALIIKVFATILVFSIIYILFLM